MFQRLSARVTGWRRWAPPALAMLPLVALACSSSTPAAAPTAETQPAPTATAMPAPTATPAPTPTAAPPPTPTTTPPTPTAVPDTPTPAPPPATPPPPTPTPGPAPTVDRVGFPQNYQTEFTVFYAFDRPSNNQQRVIYANSQAASLQPGQDFPHGSILVMETYSTKLGEDGRPILDGSGRFMRDELRGIFVMRKEPGFGEAYEHLRTGEWEYVAFRPDGSYQTRPEGTHTCAFCHQGATEDRDWVFRLNLSFEEDRYGSSPHPGANEVLIDSMSFSPRLTVPVGTTVKWTNRDVVLHTTTSASGGWDSGVMQTGGEFSHTFTQAGVFNYVCTIHPAQMRSTIEVTN